MSLISSSHTVHHVELHDGAPEDRIKLALDKKAEAKKNIDKVMKDWNGELIVIVTAKEIPGKDGINTIATASGVASIGEQMAVIKGLQETIQALEKSVTSQMTNLDPMDLLSRILKDKSNK